MKPLRESRGFLFTFVATVVVTPRRIINYIVGRRTRKARFKIPTEKVEYRITNSDLYRSEFLLIFAVSTLQKPTTVFSEQEALQKCRAFLLSKTYQRNHYFLCTFF